jgi:hypothetical protein
MPRMSRVGAGSLQKIVSTTCERPRLLIRISIRFSGFSCPGGCGTFQDDTEAGQDWSVLSIIFPSRSFGLTVPEDRISATKANPLVAAAQGLVVNNSAGIMSAATKIASSADFKALEDNVRGFQEASQVLMKALDEVTKLNPVIAGMYGGFMKH